MGQPRRKRNAVINSLEFMARPKFGFGSARSHEPE